MPTNEPDERSYNRRCDREESHRTIGGSGQRERPRKRPRKRLSNHEVPITRDWRPEFPWSRHPGDVSVRVYLFRVYVTYLRNIRDQRSCFGRLSDLRVVRQRDTPQRGRTLLFGQAISSIIRVRVRTGHIRAGYADAGLTPERRNPRGNLHVAIHTHGHTQSISRAQFCASARRKITDAANRAMRAAANQTKSRTSP